MTDAELELARMQITELRGGPLITPFRVAVARSLESLIEERDALAAKCGELESCLRECAEEAHAYGMVKHHCNPKSKSWEVETIETCENPSCVEAVRLLANTKGA